MVFSSFVPQITTAVETVWYYNEGPIIKIHSNFKSEIECENDSAEFLRLNRGLTVTHCLTTTVTGFPLPKSDPAVTYIKPAPGTIGVSENKTRYNFLVPIGNLKCMDWGSTNTVGADGKKECIDNNIGEYLNIIFKIGIGLCAALAVIMLIIYGVVYMGDESVFGKTEAKSKMLSAVLGLIIALGAWALLNTINPALTGKGGIMFDSAKGSISNFSILGSSPASFDGKPINIDFNTQAYPAAKIASEKTGVDTAFILAMFAQETGSGSNVGKCDYLSANMKDGQLDALKTVATRLGLDYKTIPMSCSGAVKGDHGGAIGLTQFLPGTWLEYTDQAKKILGHEPDPWDKTGADALMMTALFLKAKGGDGTNETNQMNAACKYFGSCSQTVSCGGGVKGTYGQCILGKKVSIQNQIDAYEAINKK